MLRNAIGLTYTILPSILLLGFSMPAAAALILGIGSGSAAVGNSVQLPVTIIRPAGDNNSVYSATFAIDFPNPPLSASVVAGGPVPAAAAVTCGVPGGNRVICVLYTNPATPITVGTYTIATVTFNVLAGSGTQSLAATVLSCSDQNGFEIPSACQAQSGTLGIEAADLSVSLGDSPDPVTAGTNLTYTAIVTNNGPTAASQVSLSLPLPAGTTFVSATPSGGGNCSAGSPVNCAWSGVTNSGAVRNAVIVVAVAPGASGTLAATAAASSNTADPNAANNSASASTSVIALPPPAITAFSAAPSTAITSSTIRLSWSASNATSCSPSLGGATNWSTLGTLPTSGSFNLTAPTSPTSVTFQLNCTNGVQSTTASVPVNVVNAPAPAVGSFSPTSGTVVAGNTITLNWTSSNAISCSPALGGNSAWSGLGTLPTSGSRNFAAPQVVGTTAITFQLNCSNGAQVATANTVINVTPGTAPTIHSFFPTQATVVVGTPITLNWSSSNATSCTPTLGSGTSWPSLGTLPATGTQSVNAPTAPTTITFQLNCTNGVQTTPRTTQVTVQPAVVAPTVDFRLAPNRVPVCGSNSSTVYTVGVSWSSTGAAYCTTSETPVFRTTFSGRKCNENCPVSGDNVKLRTELADDPLRNYESVFSFIAAGQSFLRLTCFNAAGTASAFDEETLTTDNAADNPFLCGSAPLYTPSTTVTAPAPMPDGSVQVQSSVANPQGVPLSASVLEQGQFGTASVEMVGDTVTVRYVADPGRFPEGSTATETIRVIVANGGVGVPVTYTFEVDLTLFADGFE